jgi:CxxC motif-containing protein
MPKLVDIICTNCPMGCSITLTIDEKNDKVIKFVGNKCKQGEKYAIAEYKNPVRVLTATVLTNSVKNPLLPVRTNKPIPKGKMKDFMYSLAKLRVNYPVNIGQVVYSNIMDTGIDLLATSDLLD